MTRTWRAILLWDPRGGCWTGRWKMQESSEAETYVTNVVKHFKWEPRGKRRIHAKPNSVEIAACVPWLQAELELVKPRDLVCLGATAAQALLGRQFRVTEGSRQVDRIAAGAARDRDGPPVFDSPRRR